MEILQSMVDKDNTKYSNNDCNVQTAKPHNNKHLENK